MPSLLLNAIVVDAALVPQRDGPLAGGGLAFADEKGSVDAGGEEVLGRVARNRAVVPRVLLQRVDRRHVVGGHPADVAVRRMRLAPLARLVVAEDAELLA
jgi:hypothetical protein